MQQVARMKRSENPGLLCCPRKTRIALRSIRATLALSPFRFDTACNELSLCHYITPASCKWPAECRFPYVMNFNTGAHDGLETVLCEHHRIDHVANGSGHNRSYFSERGSTSAATS